MKGKITDKDRIAMVAHKVAEVMPKLPYHNWQHAAEVFNAVRAYAIVENVPMEDRYLLETAAWLHDVVFVPERSDNEEKSAEFARKYLPTIGYSDVQTQRVEELILATKMPQRPNGFLEGLICDADLSNLGGPGFFVRGEKIKEEIGYSHNDWYEAQLGFLRAHEYHTEVGRRMNNAGKLVNIEVLETKILEVGSCL